jgi:hypothetical protein
VKRVVRVPAISLKMADIPPDDYSWRKYGQKPIKGSPHPRYKFGPFQKKLIIVVLNYFNLCLVCVLVLICDIYIYVTGGTTSVAVLEGAQLVNT